LGEVRDRVSTKREGKDGGKDQRFRRNLVKGDIGVR